MKTNLQILSVIYVCLVFTSACGNKPKTSTEAAKDQNERTIKDENLSDDADFLVKAAEGGIWEMEIGKLAEKKALTEDVKSYGKMMVRDHSKVNDELKTLAMNKNIAVPATLNEEKQKKLNGFNKKTGREFDDDYIDAMIDDHEKDIKLFEDKANDEKADADIRRWASESLPLLKQHLSEVKAIERKFDTVQK